MENETLKINKIKTPIIPPGFLGIIFLILSGICFYIFFYFTLNFDEPLKFIYEMLLKLRDGDQEKVNYFIDFMINMYSFGLIAILLIGCMFFFTSIILIYLGYNTKIALYPKTLVEATKIKIL